MSFFLEKANDPLENFITEPKNKVQTLQPKELQQNEIEEKNKTNENQENTKKKANKFFSHRQPKSKENSFSNDIYNKNNVSEMNPTAPLKSPPQQNSNEQNNKEQTNSESPLEKNQSINYFKLYNKKEVIDPQQISGENTLTKTERVPPSEKLLSKFKKKLSEAVFLIQKIHSSEEMIEKFISETTERTKNFLFSNKKENRNDLDFDLSFWLQKNSLLKHYEKFVEFDVKFEDLNLLNERKLIEMNLPHNLFLSLISSLDYAKWKQVLLAGYLYKKVSFLQTILLN